MTESQVSGAPAPEEIRFRPSVWQRVLPLLPMTMALGFDAFMRVVSPVPKPAFDVWFHSLLIVLVLTLAVASSFFGITLKPSAARVHGLRRRTILWASVQDVRVEQVMGGRVVALYEADGRRTRLRAPFTGFLQQDRRFEEKFHVIGQWWLAHRGTDWVPVPPPGSGTPTRR
ncbi:hypothetical protein OG410_22505 [Streptomyces sp. NBC_00659]|uniref:hypothetical protein n=1 Tax=Streptomyces sp. NBC_00659 TaxID=2903669 RepID=UPI002E3762EE|nr:hypothetical protein [Streptomyces sp. NBC_00659]